MKGRQLLLLLIFLFLLVSMVSAAELVSVNATLGSHPVEYIALKRPLMVTIVANITTSSSIEGVTADLSALTEDPMVKPTLADVSLVCIPYLDNETNEQLGAICSYHGATLQLTTPSAQLTFYVKANGVVEEFNKTITFEIDDEGPVISDIKSEFCEGTICYISSGTSTELQIGVTDAVGTMSLNRIYYKVGSSSARKVFRCEDNVCYGYYVGTCTSGEPIVAKITSGYGGIPSSDDAGNAVTGVDQVVFSCDALAPAEEPLPKTDMNLTHPQSLTYPSQDGLFVDVSHNPIMPHPVKGETIVLSALVTEDVSGVDAYVNTTALNGDVTLQKGTCENLGEKIYNCSWAVTDINPGEHTVYLYFKDKAGHDSTFTLGPNEKSHWLPVTIKVDDIVLAKEGPTPKFFKDISATPVSAQGYNRIALQLAYENNIDYPLYETYTLQRSNIGGEIEAVYTFISDVDRYTCEIRKDDGNQVANVTPASFEFGFVNPESKINEKNLLFVKINEPVNNIPDAFSLYCNVSVVIRQGEKKVYEEPAVFTMRIPIKLKNSALTGTPGKAFADKIIEQEKSLKKWNDVMSVADKIASEAFKYCSYAKGLSQVETTGTAVETAGYGIQIYSEPIGTKLLHVGSEINRVGSKPLSLLGTGPLTNIISNACAYATCSNANLMDTVGGDLGWFEDGHAGDFLKDFGSNLADDGVGGIAKDISGDLLKNISVPHSQDSIIASVINLCVPGIIYNLNKYRTIQCETLTCYKQSSLYGVDVSACDKGRATAICMNVVGELYEVVPYTRMMDNLMDNMGAMIETAAPTALKSVLNNFACKKWEDEEPTFKAFKLANLAVCKIPKAVGDMLYQTEKSNGHFYYPPVMNNCDAALCNNADLTTCGYSSSQYFTNYQNQKPLYYYWNEMQVNPTEVEPHYKTNEIKKVWTQVKDNEDKWDKIKKDWQPTIERMKQKGYTFDPNNPGVFKPGKNAKDANGNKITEPVVNQLYKGDAKKTFSLYENGVKELYKHSGRTDLEKFREDISKSSTSGIRDNLDNIPADSRATAASISGLFVPGTNAEIQNSRDFNELIFHPDEYLSGFSDLTKDQQSQFLLDESKRLGFYDNYVKVETVRDSIDSTTQIYNSNKKNLQEQINELNEKIEAGTVTRDDISDEFIVDVENVDPASLATLELSKLEEEQKELTEKYNQDITDLTKDLEKASDTGVVDPIKEISADDKRIRDERLSYITDYAVNQAVALAAKLGWLEWMKSTNLFGDDNAIGNFAEWTKNAVDNQKQTMCAGGHKSFAKSVNEGAALQCHDELCRPVLTQAVERVDFPAVVDSKKKDMYLYTIVYYVGNVVPPTDLPADETMKYQVFLKTANGASTSLFKEKWEELPYNQVQDFKKPIISEKKYTEMCFEFKRPYPPGDAVSNKKEYCREIVVADEGATAFDTGVPVPSDYVQKALAEMKNKGDTVGNFKLNDVFTINNFNSFDYDNQFNNRGGYFGNGY